LKELYPNAVFPPVYFVIGTLNSGGTSSNDGLIIGTEMYGLTPETPTNELDDWLKTVIKPVADVPHTVAHELIHFQQKYDVGNLLAASIKEGSADFIAQLISGKHINHQLISATPFFIAYTTKPATFLAPVFSNKLLRWPSTVLGLI
jgi:hypothetical protein